MYIWPVNYCLQGGPGYFYLLAGKVITSAKLSTNKAISKLYLVLKGLCVCITGVCCVQVLGGIWRYHEQNQS